MFCFKKKRYHQGGGGGVSSVEEESRSQDLASPAGSPGTDRPARAPPRLVVEPSSDAESLDGRSRSASCINAIDVAGSAVTVASAAVAAAVANAAPGCPDSPTDLRRSSSAGYSLPGSYADSGPPSPVSNIAKVGGKQRGRSLELPGICVHCLHYETWLAQNPASPSPQRRRSGRSSSPSSSSSTDSGGSRGSSIVSSRSPSDDSRGSSDDEKKSDDEEEEEDMGAIMVEEEEEEEDSAAPTSRHDDATTDDSGRSTPNPSPSSIGSSCGGVGSSGAFLQVPVVKPRASSVDVAIYRSVGSSESASRRSSLDLLATPSKPRAASVDVQLPTNEHNHYHARTNSGQPPSLLDALRAIATSSSKMIARTNLLHPNRTELERKDTKIKSSVDWTDDAVNGEHLWYDSSNANNDFCYVTDAECNKFGSKRKCAACKIVIHKACYPPFEKMNVKCRQTFREASVRNYRDGTQQQQNFIRHHWVHRRRQDGRCRQCGKSFQQRFSFNNKDVIAIGCSWCKAVYHNKSTCFQLHLISEHCSMGVHSSLIVPPTWIVKIPKRNSFKSSVRRRRSNSASGKRHRAQTPCPFVVKQVPFSQIRPLLVFINPRSGGNQGVKLMHKFNWYLNPRQVFDLSQPGGPKKGLELYKKVPNLRVLACGGDGTVGWILSEIDAMGITPRPPVAILPLGTGNDLSRMLGWGPGYTDEPVSKILNSIDEGRVAFLDRWNIKVENNSEASAAVSAEEAGGAKGKLSINVFNNYFSLGADAATTLEFHESREANPEKFNSRLKNKMFYAGCGGKDLLKRSWKDLCDHVQLVCDDNDLTSKIRELKLHCLLFLNIEKYSSGTSPWGSPHSSTGFEPQLLDDGFLEVIGFTSTSLATLQVGGHGERICQCRQAVITTTKAIPMQVDGEPSRLRASKITISRRNQARIVMKAKRRMSLSREDISDFSVPKSGIIPERLRLQVAVLRLSDYEEFVFDTERLRAVAVPMGIVVVESDADLHSMRRHVMRLAQDTPLVSPRGRTHLSDKWLFLDSATSDRFFRIDKLQEKLHFVTDIAVQELYVLDLEQSSSDVPALPTPDDLMGNIRLEVSAESDDAGDAHDTATSDGASISERLFAACACGDVASLQRLLSDQPQEVRGARDSNGDSALHVTCAAGRSDVAKLLLTDAPDSFVNAVNTRSRQTSLHMAIEVGHSGICRLLLDAGASLSVSDRSGRTPTELAALCGHEEIARLLATDKTTL